MFSMNSGEFRHKITILRPTIGKNEDNIPGKLEKELFTTKAKVTNVRGSEAQIGQGTTYKQEKRVHLRVNRRKTLFQNDIILFKGQKYNITYVNNIEERDMYYELKIELIQ